MPISVPFTSGCACGAIRYECSAEPLLTWRCHCRDCQRYTGSDFICGVFVPTAAFTLTKGNPKYYVVKGGSGSSLHRGFCSDCGSPVIAKADAFPDFRGVPAASLDDPSGVKPAADIWTSSAQPWDYMDPALPKYEHQPTEEEMQALLALQG